MVKLKRYFQI